jgi:hypothetical protein
MKGLRYLYIFEDNTMAQSAEGPTDADLHAIQQGCLYAIRLNPTSGAFEELSPEGTWDAVEEARVSRGEGEDDFHTTG